VTRRNPRTVSSISLSESFCPIRMPGKDAKGCDIYNRAPCPMCTSAIYWSRIDHLYFGASLEDTSHIRFSDEFQYQDFTLP
jgi:guanine deaminase